MERIVDRNSGRVVVVPLDHGISMGPIPGLIDMRDTINKISLGGATAVLMHKGMVPYGHRTSGKDIGLIVHLSAGTVLAGIPTPKLLSPPFRGPGPLERDLAPFTSTLVRTPNRI